MKSGKDKSSPRRLIVRSIILLVVMTAGILIIYARKDKSLAADANERLDKMEAGTVVKVVKASLCIRCKRFSICRRGSSLPKRCLVCQDKRVH